ncbi:sigma-70 family RNA polymerase sigma factor [Alloalcanivorax gelatiniphagus]|uniref:Sigma-70 family RNA polymerase sigma factor n=1 Tax=Alloalcanivorax gelatiniphagus TaxID=1194167 RepID=A0ABY2XMD9_9GAMM|nr:sigma-70 family RNA polymerase sigma factor [Alloalcanivorax gelatiniphagus]TMW13032.1 sigma-70 family RNA polymerase sigma factor [Alloalcanivorax gelatiniphagus]|tara:strand:+ start:17524 stop:18048 length:525 start_codon:yes stop_codon:yes gene_type:complete
MGAESYYRNEAVKVLYCHHHGWLTGWLRKKLGCSHRAADMAQDTFLRILTSQADLGGIKEPRAYLTTIAGRLIIDDARRKKVEQLYLETWSALHGQDAAPSSQALAEVVELISAMARLLDGLPEKPRRAFLMSRLEGRPHGDIARELGVSVSMIKKYVASALLHCLELLDEAPR